MKKLLPIAACVILGVSSLAYAQQTPEAFKYQASLRNVQGEVIANKLVSIRVVILSADKAVYSEVHTVSTNQLGLVNFEIGRGTRPEGKFSAINWDASKHFVRIEMDEQGGRNYKELGTSELLSVPYSLHATMASDVMPGSVTIQNEIAARQAGDDKLQGQINIVRGMLEQGAKGSGNDNALGIPQDLEALKVRYMADSVAVRSLITSSNTNISSEVTRATGVESGLRTDVNTATSTNNSQATSIANNTSAIATNATAIAAETARALAAEAALDAKIGTSGGSGILRMTTDVRDGMTPQGGEMIYNTSVNRFQGYQGVIAPSYIDQNYFTRWSTIGFDINNTPIAQSFTAAMTDSLSGITLSSYYSQGNQNYILKIYEGDGTNGNVLSQQNVTITGTNNNYSYSEMLISIRGVALTAGNQYTFELSAPDNEYRYMAMWFTIENDANYNPMYNYTGGKLYQNGSPYTYTHWIWNGYNDYTYVYSQADMLFKTHMKGVDGMGWVNMR
ncbi:MAG: hypothetical protein V4642_03050 [Bacteroidota bacterium]